MYKFGMKASVEIELSWSCEASYHICILIYLITHISFIKFVMKLSLQCLFIKIEIIVFQSIPERQGNA